MPYNITKTFVITPEHVRKLKKIKTRHKFPSNSEALRFAINKTFIASEAFKQEKCR